MKLITLWEVHLENYAKIISRALGHAEKVESPTEVHLENYAKIISRALGHAEKAESPTDEYITTT